MIKTNTSFTSVPILQTSYYHLFAKYEAALNWSLKDVRFSLALPDLNLLEVLWRRRIFCIFQIWSLAWVSSYKIWFCWDLVKIWMFSSLLDCYFHGNHVNSEILGQMKFCLISKKLLYEATSGSCLNTRHWEGNLFCKE